MKILNLFILAVDPTEENNLATAHPDKVRLSLPKT